MADVNRGTRRWWVGLVPLLLILHAVLAITAIRSKSATFDEMVRLTVGYSYWVTGDYRLDTVEPPLSKMWAAVSLLGGKYRFPDLNQPAWWISDAESMGRQFFFALGNDTSAMLFRARVMNVLLSVLLGLVVWFWSRHLFGPAGACLSLGLYAVCPNMLAHAGLVSTEIAACLFFLASLGAIVWLLRTVSPVSVLAAGVSLCGLFLSKMSAPLILPVGILLLAVRVTSGEPLSVSCLKWQRSVRSRWARLAVWLAVMAVLVLMVGAGIWGAFRFRYNGLTGVVEGRDRYCPIGPIPPGSEPFDYLLRTSGTTGQVVRWVADHRLLPEAYLYGAVAQSEVIQFWYSFLNGRRSIVGWWYFFPYTFLVKTPPALFGIGVLAILAGFTLRRRSRVTGQEPDVGFGDAWGALVLFLLIYWAVAMRANLNIGHRHILPTYPILFVLFGAIATVWRLAGRWFQWSGGALCAAMVASSLSTWPDYLAYFNVLIGGPNRAYTHLVDSSLDWGQDLPGLKTWQDRRSAGAKAASEGRLYLSYFGTDNPERFGIEAEMLPSHMEWRPPTLEPLSGGNYCISATMLQLMYIMPTNEWTETFESAYQLLRPEYEAFRGPIGPANEEAGWFRLLRFARICTFLRSGVPDAQIHHTILVYRLSDQDVRRMLTTRDIQLARDDPYEAGPVLLDWMHSLGQMLAKRGRFEEAVPRFEKVLSYQPSRSGTVHALVSALLPLGRYERAIAVLRDAVPQKPNDVGLLNDLAWLLATCPEDRLRDGAEAIRLADRALRLSSPDSWGALDTCAAAYAETGQFTPAAQYAQRAAELARQNGKTDQADAIARRAVLYQAGKPYRIESRGAVQGPSSQR